MIKEEKPSEFQVKVLETILNNSIKSISYKHPEIELGDVVEGKNLEEILKVLRKLEEKGALSYTPKKKFWFFDKSSYVVDMAQAEDVYDSYQEKLR